MNSLRLYVSIQSLQVPEPNVWMLKGKELKVCYPRFRTVKCNRDQVMLGRCGEASEVFGSLEGSFSSRSERKDGGRSKGIC